MGREKTLVFLRKYTMVIVLILVTFYMENRGKNVTSTEC